MVYLYFKSEKARSYPTLVRLGTSHTTEYIRLYSETGVKVLSLSSVWDYFNTLLS
jgi:hypothetical protein